MGSSFTDEDLDALREEVRARAADVAVALLGEPTSGRRGHEWRWQRKKSLSVVVRGPKRGGFRDHETLEDGDLITLARRELGRDFRSTVEWLRGTLGMGAASYVPHKPRPRAEKEAEKAAIEAEDRERMARAQRLWSDACPIEGTVAERYLVERRKIPKPPVGWPDAVRFHPQRCALILAATTEAGAVQAVQLVHLTPDGRKRVEEGKPTKQSFGPQAGAVVRLPGLRDVLQLAEGPETSLSAWTATGAETWICLGSMARVQPPALRRLVVCADDDPRDAPAAKLLRKAVSQWRGEGREVTVALPWSPRRFDKSDFNDLAQREGIAAVRVRIGAATAPSPPPTGGRLPAPLARHRLAGAVAGFFREVRAFDPEQEDMAPPVVHAIRAGVGTGKSLAARKEAATLLAELRQRGDARTGILLVPTHRLGEEQAGDFEALPEAQAAGLRAAVWRGREAPDPAQSGRAMCHDLDAVRDAQAVGMRPDTAACHDKARGIWCPFHPNNPDRPENVRPCGYQLQKQQKADLWICAHELLFHEKPAVMGKPAFVVVDEAIFAKGLEGANDAPVELTAAALDPEVTIPGDVRGLDTEHLRYVHRRLAELLAHEPLGPLRRASALAAGLSEETARVCRAHTWRRVVHMDLVPGMTPAERRSVMAAAPNNRAAMRVARLFEKLEALLAEGGPEASGWVSVAQAETEDGPVRVLRLRGRRKVGKAWHVPTLILDALLNPDLVRPYWAQVEMTAEIEATTPHMRVRQMIGRDWAKNAMVPDAYAGAEEGERRLKNSERVRAAVLREARKVDGRVLVVAQKAVEEYWRSCGPLPNNVEFAHYNAVAGRDEWGPGADREGVRLVILVGRPLPRQADVERMAEALTGASVTARCSRYDRVDVAITLADGTSATTEADRHPDPMAEAIRWQICEGELIQTIGRGRGVNRTAENPLDVLVLTDRPLPVPVDEAVSWEALAPSPADLMMAQAGVALDDSADAARCFPNLWGDGVAPSPEAARKAFQRAKCGTSPYKRLPIGECPALLRTATYRRAGQGKRTATLIFDPSAVAPDDLRGWLEDRVGPLTLLEIHDPPDRPDPPGGNSLRPGKKSPGGEGATGGNQEHRERAPGISSDQPTFPLHGLPEGSVTLDPSGRGPGGGGGAALAVTLGSAPWPEEGCRDEARLVGIGSPLPIPARSIGLARVIVSGESGNADQ